MQGPAHGRPHPPGVAHHPPRPRPRPALYMKLFSFEELSFFLRTNTLILARTLFLAPSISVPLCLWPKFPPPYQPPRKLTFFVLAQLASWEVGLPLWTPLCRPVSCADCPQVGSTEYSMPIPLLEVRSSPRCRPTQSGPDGIFYEQLRPSVKCGRGLTKRGKKCKCFSFHFSIPQTFCAELHNCR